MLKYLKRGFALGVGLTAGILATALVAVTVSGTVTVFEQGQVVSAAQINENFASLKAAIEVIPATNAGVTQAQLDQIAAPIGSIMAWHKDLPGSPTIPAGWVQCDGQVLSDADSPYNGMTLPNLNTGAMLIGSATSSSTVTAGGTHLHGVTGTTDAVGNHQHVYIPGPGGAANTTADGGHSHTMSFNSANASPFNQMSIVWIMRIK